MPTYRYSKTGLQEHKCDSDGIEQVRFKISNCGLRNCIKTLLCRRFDQEQQNKRNADNVRYIICDIEVNQEKDNDGYMTHKPNLIVSYHIISPHAVVENVGDYVC